jgi:hypothetical protein
MMTVERDGTSYPNAHALVFNLLPPAIANPKAFTSENGDVDEAKLTSHLTTLFGVSEPQQQRNYGQHSGHPAGDRAGEAGRAALKRRHGIGTDDQPTAAGRARPGDAGRAAALGES